MDRSLWLLIGLRTKGMLRRWKRTFSRPRGIVLGVFTALLFGSWLVSVGATMMVRVEPPLDPIRRFAPLGLLAFTLLSLFTSAGEQALYYSPAEVAFLIAGPYRRRQLIAYKLFVTLSLCSVSAAFFSIAGGTMSPSAASAFVGSLLLVLFFQLLQMVLGLAASTAGAMAWGRGRMVAIGALLALTAAAAATAGLPIRGPFSLATLDRLQQAPAMSAILTPFRWFVRAFTARTLPELAAWAWPCLAVDLTLIGLVFALEASYVEAAAAASARRYARMQRMLSGGGALRAGGRSTGRFRFRPPAVPWWGGVGPNFWRQMTAALGDPRRLLGLFALLILMPVIFGILAARDPKTADAMVYTALGLILWMSINLSLLLPFDFRGDIDMIEELKALPLSPTRMALGQLLTPTLISTGAQGVAMAGTLAALGAPDPALWSGLAFLLPVNLTFFAIENLLFLWYPSRVVAGQFDVMAVGRQILFLMGKVIGLGLGLVLASLAGGLAYLVTKGLAPSLIAAWATMMATGLALVPLVGQAFDRFDVSRDVPA